MTSKLVRGAMCETITFASVCKTNLFVVHLTLEKVAGLTIVALGRQLVRVVIANRIAIAPILHIYTCVYAFRRTHEKMFISAIVTQHSRCV